MRRNFLTIALSMATGLCIVPNAWADPPAPPPPPPPPAPVQAAAPAPQQPTYAPAAPPPAAAPAQAPAAPPPQMAAAPDAAAGGENTHSGEMGIQVSLPAGGDPTFGFTYFVADHAALRVDLGLGITSASNASQSVSGQLGVRWYFADFEKFMPFFQPAIFVSNPNSQIAFAVEGGLGGEYFITKHFSFGGQTGAAFQVASQQNGPAIVKFTTGTSAIFGQFLW